MKEKYCAAESDILQLEISNWRASCPKEMVICSTKLSSLFKSILSIVRYGFIAGQLFIVQLSARMKKNSFSLLFTALHSRYLACSSLSFTFPCTVDQCVCLFYFFKQDNNF
jgi:hypothetical protein